MSVSFYVKAVVSILGAVFAALAAALADNAITTSEWVNVGIAFVGACAVFAAPNVPGANYTKAILAALTALLTVYSSGVTAGFSIAEIAQSAASVLTAFGVYFVANAVPTHEELADIRRGKHEAPES